MKNALLVVSTVLSLLIIIFVLIQGRGAGLGSAWGGGGELFTTRRGIEKWTLRLTVLLIILFFIVSLVKLLL